MPRFFYRKRSAPETDIAVLTGEAAAHARVLRLKSGEQVVLCDGQGTDYQAEISHIDDKSVTLRILSQGPSESEPKVDCTVYMGFAKGDKLEHVIQKATELGAARICAFSQQPAAWQNTTGKPWRKSSPDGKKSLFPQQSSPDVGEFPRCLRRSPMPRRWNWLQKADRALFFYENEQSHTLTAALTPAITPLYPL